MSIEKLKELGEELIDLSKDSDICAKLIELSLRNLMDSFLEPKDDQINYNDFDNILPPQIRSTNAAEPILSNQPSIFGQDILPPIMGNQINSNMLQAQHVPFLFHNPNQFG